MVGKKVNKKQKNCCHDFVLFDVSKKGVIEKCYYCGKERVISWKYIKKVVEC
ncbi:MAG: hypothetical protein QW038_02515 [Nanopusillaceae archaeon]